MFGGFSSKFGPASFAPPSTPLAPQTIQEWKTVLDGVKSLYLQGQYRRCTAVCTDLLRVATQPVRSTPSELMFYATDVLNADGAYVQNIPLLLSRHLL